MNSPNQSISSALEEVNNVVVKHTSYAGLICKPNILLEIWYQGFRLWARAITGPGHAKTGAGVVSRSFMRESGADDARVPVSVTTRMQSRTRTGQTIRAPLQL